MTLRISTIIRFVALVGVCAIAITCDSATHPPVPTAIAAQAGNNQSATVGTAVSVSPSVLVTDNRGGPAAGVIVTFAVASGGGSITSATQITGADGIATVGGWTLGTTVGTNTLMAVASALTGSPVTFTAIGTASTASAITANAGEAQTATAGAAVATNPSIKVTDVHGNPVAGVNVAFAVASGGGTVVGSGQTTGTNGFATVSGWTLGTTAGTNTLTATAAGLTGSPVTFTATGNPGPASVILLNAGNNQTATVASTLSTNAAVKVTDANANAVSGVGVTFVVAAGGGSVNGSTQITASNGIATVGGWTLGITAGTNTLTATAPSLTGSPVTFTATGTAGPPSGMTKTAGDGQTVMVGTTLPIKAAARVTDAYGNAVAGAAVAFNVATGGGSLIDGNLTTNASGIATVGSWTLGCSAGANQLTASSAGLSALTFTANATAAPAVNQVSVRPTAFGMLIGDTVTLVASPTDASGSPVPCTTTTWGMPSSAAVSISTVGLVTAVASGFATVPSTTSGVSANSTMSVYSAALLDSVRFVYTSGGNTFGWTETSLAVGQSKCFVQLYTFDPNNQTSALRWEPAVSDSTVMRVNRRTSLPQEHCFEALKAGTVTVFGTFGGKTGQKSITIP